MAGNNYELELETQIAQWQSSRHVDGLVEFIRRRRRFNIQMRMSGLLWSIEARPLPNTTDYNFDIMEVKRSKSPLRLSKATTADLPAKFKLLFVTLQTFMKSTFRVEELLDKLYACSRLLSRAENDKRWWIIVDAEIMAVACKTAREATQEAAEAAAAFLAEVMEPLEYFPRQHNRPSFSATEIWNRIAQAAVDGGDVLQWCNFEVKELDNMIPRFEFEVAVQDFLQGNDEICKIGVVNSHALKVTVDLEDEIWVVCSQEGVETEMSLGLRSLLPQLIRNYIANAVLETSEWKDNIAESLVQRVVGYLTFLPRVCELCGSHRLLEDSLTSLCSNLCAARRDSLPLKWATEAAQEGLSTLDDDDGNDDE